MGADTRASPRYAVEAAIEIRSAVAAAVATANGSTTNVSRGGLSALVDHLVERGALVRVSITLVFSPDSFSEPLDLPARIVWATTLGPARHQVGLSFTQLSSAEHSYLDMFLRYLEQDAAAPDRGDEGTNEDEDPFAS
ncbi:MAG TPA: PilZ domain-containing protein [Kofleriaceae bacterium]|nr:PilZ domain-containing protein [Kofleriaceae bacterium]